MSELMRPPRVWSDFDGTGVEIVAKTNPRNWSKYPLQAIDGYIDFLKGVRDGGVEIAGIISRRPAIRKWVTARSIAKLGMDEVFPGVHPFVLAGSEDRKADFLANQSRYGVVGMIDDKPHKFGASLLKSLAEAQGQTNGDKQLIVLGAIDHSKKHEYLDRLADIVDEGNVGHLIEAGSGFYINGTNFGVKVVPLEPYSAETGEAFAGIINRITA
jgi:hypothetical protein